MTLEEVNQILRDLQPSAKKKTKAQKKGKIGRLGLVKLTVRTGKKESK